MYVFCCCYLSWWSLIKIRRFQEENNVKWDCSFTYLLCLGCEQGLGSSGLILTISWQLPGWHELNRKIDSFCIDYLHLLVLIAKSHGSWFQNLLHYIRITLQFALIKFLPDSVNICLLSLLKKTLNAGFLITYIDAKFPTLVRKINFDPISDQQRY